MLRPSNHKRSKLQEKSVAADFGGRVTPGSGNQWHSKGDIKTSELLIECKTTTHQSYSITRTTWEKINREALLSSTIPVMLLDISGLELVVLSKDDFTEMGLT